MQEDTLRLKASLERVQRLTDSFADAQLDTFAARAAGLGGGLGIEAEVQNVFTEAEIRANVTFQLSKLNTDLLQACREQLGMGDYDGIVSGDAVGQLVEVDSIQPGQEHAGGKPCVLLVRSATGDEEVRVVASSDLRNLFRTVGEPCMLRRTGRVLADEACHCCGAVHSCMSCVCAATTNPGCVRSSAHASLRD